VGFSLYWLFKNHYQIVSVCTGISLTVILILCSIAFAASSFTTIPVVQITMEKQSIRSVALHRLCHWFDIPLYARLPKIIERGTGWFLDSQTIVTNHHVIAGALSLGVEWKSGEIKSAEIIGGISEFDIALLRMHEPIELTEFWSFSDAVSVGEQITMGGFGQSKQWQTIQGEVIGLHEKEILVDEKQSFMVIDRPVLPGFSGGPAWNENGDLVGMVTAMNEEHSYVISIEYVRDNLSLLLANVVPEWGYLGINLEGMNISSVNRFGPAKDIPTGKIQQIQGKKIESDQTLQSILRRLHSGDEVSLVVAGKNYSIHAHAIHQWQPGITDGCVWRGASMRQQGEHWKVVSLSEKSPLLSMGVLPNDKLLIPNACSELQQMEHLLLVSLLRDDISFTVIIPSSI
jgi:S1-C subfamily serine protease